MSAIIKNINIFPIINIIFFRSLIYFESGLYYHLTDAKVAYISRVAYKLYKFTEESMPETFESINMLFSDHSQKGWRQLTIGDFYSAFRLIAIQLNVCLIVFILECLYYFIKTVNKYL